MAKDTKSLIDELLAKAGHAPVEKEDVKEEVESPSVTLDDVKEVKDVKEEVKTKKKKRVKKAKEVKEESKINVDDLETVEDTFMPEEPLGNFANAERANVLFNIHLGYVIAKSGLPFDHPSIKILLDA